MARRATLVGAAFRRQRGIAGYGNLTFRRGFNYPKVRNECCRGSHLRVLLAEDTKRAVFLGLLFYTLLDAKSAARMRKADGVDPDLAELLSCQRYPMEPSPPNPHFTDAATESGLRAEEVVRLAVAAGFAEAGLVVLPYAGEERDAAWLEEWIRSGYAASMEYLTRRNEAGELIRARIGRPFPWACSAIVCWAPYLCVGPPSLEPDGVGTGTIGRYARSSKPGPNGEPAPSDYHKVLLKRLRAVEAALHAQVGAFEARAFVDTGPFSERALALAAGLGWVGKNACLIHPRLGSFGFLAVLLTSLSVKESQRAEAPQNRCGSCQRCLAACPTGALVEPGVVDARRCIAYLTIEHRGPIAEELMGLMGNRIFGCDVCQEVCPWTPAEGGPRRVGEDQELAERPELVAPPLEWLGGLTEAEFEKKFNGSPVRRARYDGLRRNVAIAMGNSGLAEFVPRLRSWAEAEDEGLRAAARWALGRIEAGKVSGSAPGPS